MPEQTLSNLIGDIYDAAIDPTLWQDVLRKTSDYVGGCAASIYSKNSFHKTADITYDFGVDHRFQQSYVDEYVRMDPTTAGFFFFDIEEIVTISDILPYEEFLSSRFYREWVQPQGWIDMATSVLEKSSTSYAVFSVFRHEDNGPSDQGVRERMQLLAPHVRRATLIGNTIQLQRAEAATLADTLDRLTAALFLVDVDGRLHHANQSGHLMLSEGSVLRAVSGRLRASDPALDDMLRSAHLEIDTDSGLTRHGNALPMTAVDGQRYVAHILPLTAGSRRKAGIGRAVTVAIFVSKAQIESPLAPEIIARAYGLTPSELRVLLAVFDSNGVNDIASTLGITEATTKTHLHRLFSKTGTKRQADLIKLVAGFVGPNG